MKPGCSPRCTTPNIGHIYWLDETEGQKALVPDLVEGSTLAGRTKPRAIPRCNRQAAAREVGRA